MKKFTTKLISLVIIVASLNIHLAFASFTDLNESHKNFQAITALQELGIIEGYSDGSFKPEQSVNRAEFLKIILEGSDIPLDVTTETPFKDVNHSDWYGPYIKKAYDEGWLVGYEDGTARPGQTINKVEALKILGEVQQWELETVTSKPFSDTPKAQWYTSYVSYAKSHNYLEETGELFEPDSLMTRASISEIIFRTISDQAEEEKEEIKEVEEVEEVTEIESQTETETDIETSNTSKNTTEIPSKKISSDFYDNIKLKEDFPESFFVNEIYVFEGEVTSSETDSVTILLEEESSKDQMTFIGELNNKSFSVAVHFDEPGDHLLGLVPGESGSSKATTIKVLDKNPELEANEEADLEKFYFEDQESKIKFDSQSNNFKEFVFSQGSKSVTYLNRQNVSEIPIFYKDFKNFKEDDVTLKLSTASDTDSLKFKASKHHFSKIETSSINSEIPETSLSDIDFNGSTKTEINQKAYVIKPDGFVDQFNLETSASTTTYFSSQIISSNSDFSFDYESSQEGSYIIEINQKDNTAVVNHPIYVGNIVPLIPDYFDLHEREIFTGTVDLEDMRQELLSEINESRTEHGLDPIVLSAELNNLAQDHSQDMKDNNYFGHINLNGQSPEDRRIDAGINTSVGENLAVDVSIKFAHEGLMRSAAHRDNILDPSWERVGIGIVEDDGTLIVTQEFSIDAVQESDLIGFKTELINEINKLRSDANLADLVYEDVLQDASQYINDAVIDNNKTLNQDLFEETLDEFNILGSSQALSRIFTIWDSILQSIVVDEKDTLQESSWDSLGVDLQLDDIGNIHTIILLNN